MTFQQLQEQILPFGTRLTAVLQDLQLLDACSQMMLDHICVRLPTISQVEDLEQELNTVGQHLSTALVNGRPIMIYDLHTPLQVGEYWSTTGVELPFPKVGKSYPDGWEHVEFVLPHTENNFDALRNRFNSWFPHLIQPGFVNKYTRHDSEPQAAGDQQPNPTIALQSAGIGIKFHALPIQAVVGK